MSEPIEFNTGPEVTQSSPQPTEKFDRLKDLLRAMFQLDRGDLDFGLYRIMNLKAAEIETFLENDLLPQVKTVLAGIANYERTALYQALAEAKETARKLKVDPDKSGTVVELKQKLAEAKADVAVEADIYNHLANFFARYYAEGDFIPQRRYSGGSRSAYLIPYDGEEVKLHWANQDQYYVKSTENYASYIFSVGTGQAARRIRFEIAAADSEKDNIKEASDKQRRFLLTCGKNAVTLEGRDLVVRFDHRPLTEREKKTYPGGGSKQQDRINEAARQRIFKALEPDWLALLASPTPTESHPDRSVLDKHLAVYTARNSFDYFIHKDLGGFLRRELDFYLKNEVLNLDDLAVGEAARLNRALARTQAVRHVADKIITFLAQLEEFQKQLWLKKKFVLETHWCVTLDRVPEALYPEIIANDAQHNEWVKLFAIDKIEGNHANGNTGYTHPLTQKFLKTNPYLVLDTRHFDPTFTDKLLAELSDTGLLEDQLDGLLVHGENFQTLNLLKAKYRGRAKAIHIDPPYNTNTSGFLYKNGYQHSSWLSMMNDRIIAGRSLLCRHGAFLCHIDENEYERLHYLFANLPIPDSGTIVWDKKNPMLGRQGIATQHEYVLWRTWSEYSVFMRPANIRVILAKAEAIIREHRGVNEQVRRKFSNWIKNRKDLTGGERAYQLIDDNGNVFQSVAMGAPEPRTDPKFHRPLIHPVTKKPCPVPSNGWSRAPETMQQLVRKDEIVFGKDEAIQPRRKVFLTANNKRQMSSVISDSRRGKGDVDKLGLDFPYCHPVSLYEELLAAAAPKSDDLVLDYFAGSGTTGHAVINLNRDDGGRRKYVLVEVGHHFNTVLLPRIKQVVYSPDWKEGQPVSRNGSTQCFKYIRLESYEDTLDGLELTPQSDTQKSLLAGNAGLAEDYRLRYTLGQETSESACLLGKHFTDPSAYTLSVVRDGVRRGTPVDLPETFNFLIGLRLESRRRIDGVLAVTGVDVHGRKCLILWRNLSETDNTALEAWFARNLAQFADSLNLVYVNGDHTLTALKQPNETWTAKTIEPIFRELMFGGND